MAAGILLPFLNRFQDERLLLSAHASNATEPASTGGRSQFIQRAHAERGVKERDGFWTDSLQTEQVQHGWRELLQELLMKLADACGSKLNDLGRELLATSRQLAQPGGIELADGLSPARNRVRGSPVCADFESVFSFDLQQVGDLREDARDRPVIHASGRPARW